MELGARGDCKTDIQIALQAFEFRPGILKNRKLGEGRVAGGDNLGPQSVGFGFGVLYQESVIGHGS